MNVQDWRRALTGPIGSLRTAFNRDGSIDWDGTRRQIDYILNAGGRVTLVTAGDSHLLCMSDAEITQINRVAAEHTAGRVPVVGADWDFGTPQAVAFAKEAKAFGVDILMIRPPDWAGATTPQTVTAHFKAVAEHIPVMLVTNIFQYRPESFGFQTIAMVRDQVPGVLALKEDLTNEFARRSAMLTYDRWAVFAGGGLRNHLNMHAFGCDGFMDRHMNFAPRVSQEYWAAIQRNDLPAAVKVSREVELPLEEHLGKYTGGRDAAIHGLLEVVGVCGRWRRPPYYSLSDAEMAELKAFVKGMGLV